MRLTTKELSKRTWSDFETFFSQVHGCACTFYSFGRHLTLPGKTATERAELYGAPDRSRKHFPAKERLQEEQFRAIKELVWHDRAHGILVYADGEPVGWCQFGRVANLPVRSEHRVPAKMYARDPASQWRITCFTTRMDFRRKGVANTALAAAIEAIRKQGGGWVEANPIAFAHDDPEIRKLRKTFGWRSEQVREHLKNWPEKDIPGVGRVKGSLVGGRALNHFGTMSMFERVGFQPVRRYNPAGSDQWWIPLDRVLMRLKV